MMDPIPYDESAVRASLKVGGVYLVHSGEDDQPYAVAKILSIDGDALWLKLFRDLFAERPEYFDPERMQSGYLVTPFSVAGFLAWGPPKFPALLGEEAVTATELALRAADLYPRGRFATGNGTVVRAGTDPSFDPDRTDCSSPDIPPDVTITANAAVDRLLAGGWSQPPVLRDLMDNPPFVRPVHRGRRTTDPDRYQFVGEIARGGMGIILKGRDPDLGRDLAVKVLKPELVGREESEQRFVEEAWVGGQLQHPGIVPVYEFGWFGDGRPYFTMKLVRGHTLAAMLADRADPSVERAKYLSIFHQACQTVAYAHSMGVVHRDLKPANIMVGKFGEVLVMDWGLAKVLPQGGKAEESPTSETSSESPGPDDVPGPIRTSRPEAGGGSDTTAGSILGTPSFMPPEQAAGEVEKVDERADVFGLGSVLCVILTGRPPYVGETRDAVRRQSTRGELEDAYARLNDCGADPDLIKLCQRCLARERDARPRNAKEVADAVAAYLAGVEGRARLAEMDRAKADAAAAAERKRRRTQQALAVSLLALAAAGGIGAWIVQRHSADRELQHERVRVEVDGTLAHLPDLYRRGLWTQAETQVGQALTLLGPEGDPELRSRVETAARDTALVKRLDQIRMDKVKWTGERFSFSEAPDQYAAAFAEHGLDVRQGDPAEVARRIAASPVREHLVAALDDWSLTESEADKRRPVFRVAAAATGEAWRADLPRAWDDRARLAELYERIPRSERTAAVVEAAGWRLARLGQRGRPWLDPVDVRRLEDGLRQYPGDFWLLFRLGDAYRQLEKPKLDLAVGAYRAALAVRPDNPVILVLLGVTLRANGDLDGAIATLQDATRADPDLAGAYMNLGGALQAKGHLPEAIEQFTRATELAPNSAAMHYALASALKSAGEVDRAIAAYRDAIRVGPDYPEPHCDLGRLLRDQGRLTEALAELKHGHKLKDRRWGMPLPTAEWVKDCERLIQLDEQVRKVKVGGPIPDKPADAVELADFCRRPFKREHALAFRLYAAAFAADPALVATKPVAAAAAALRCAAADDPSTPIGVDEWYYLHKCAREWLTAGLVEVRRQVASDRRRAAETLGGWKTDPDLATIRDPAWTAAMPGEERAAWQSFWEEVEKVRKTATSSSRAD